MNGQATAAGGAGGNRKKILLGVLGGLGCLGLLILMAAAVAGYYYFNGQRETNEQYAIYGLQNIAKAQTEWRFSKGRGRYGTLDDLKNAGLLNSYGEWLGAGSHGYRLEMNITGNSFEAYASPKTYSWVNGRKSFVASIDGRVRGADHGGGRATGSDPPTSAY